MLQSKHICVLFPAAVIWITVVPSANGRVPGTLNFQNLTPTHVNMTVAEVSTNEKEVEYGDFDNDGDLDVVMAVGMSAFGERRNKLYRNDAGVFNEISGMPAIPGFSDSDVTRTAFFRDYDKDGWLDVIVVNDNNASGQAGRTKLYMNQHPGGVFSHFTDEGIERLGLSTGGAACGATSANFDGVDGDDLYVGNYPGPSQDTVYYNDNTGYFTDFTGSHVPSDGDYTVDVASADLNGDGRIDLLVSNFNPNFIYYNNNNGAGTADGDFDYPGSTHNLGAAGSGENAMEPGDFDNDGDQDVYWTNGGAGGDVILVNEGNDVNGKATLTTLSQLPASTTGTSRKATVVDLNLDGRDDIIVMTLDSRPTILRNVTLPGGTISFVDWTPGDAFPGSAVHGGWHSAAFDFADDDSYPDIFLGGISGDHVFRNTDSNEVPANDIGGDLPALYNLDPVAVVSDDGYVLEVLARGEDPGDTPGPACTAVPGADTYSLTGVPSGALVAVVLNGCADYNLQATNSSGTPLTTSDRGAEEVEEFLEFNAPGGTLCLNVAAAASCDDVVCELDVDCDDSSDCTIDTCEGGDCVFTSILFGDVDDSGLVDLNDLTCVMDAFTGSVACPQADIFPCSPDAVINVDDILSVVDAFAGINPCCGG
jgi:hypothetical protein